MAANSSLAAVSWLAGLVFAIDQLLKALFLQTQPSFGWPAAGLTLHYNPATAFSLPLPAPWPLIIAIGFFFLLCIAVISARANRSYLYPLLVMLAAAASNLLDRLARDGVIDYLAIGPAYLNLADLALVVAALILLKNIVFATTQQT